MFSAQFLAYVEMRFRSVIHAIGSLTKVDAKYDRPFGGLHAALAGDCWQLSTPDGVRMRRSPGDLSSSKRHAGAHAYSEYGLLLPAIQCGHQAKKY